MSDEIKSVLIETRNSFKVTTYFDTANHRSTIAQYDDWRKIPQLAELLAREKIDLSNYNGKLYIQFNRDGSINLIKQPNES